MLMFLQTAYPDVSVPSVPAFAVVGPTSTPCSMPPCGSGGAGCSGAWVNCKPFCATLQYFCCATTTYLSTYAKTLISCRHVAQ